MSLLAQAQAKAVEVAAAAQTAAQRRHADRVAMIAAKIEEKTGHVPEYAGDLRVASVGYESVGGFGGPGRAVKVPKYADLPVFRIEDVELAVKPEGTYGYTNGGGSITVVHTDPDHGRYEGGYIHGAVRGADKASVQVALLTNLANAIARREPHPVVQAQAEGSTCHACGRGWDQ